MITLIVPYYNQHALIYDQFRRWSNYSADIQSNIEAIIVDDGSKREPLRTVFAQAEEAGDLPAIMPVLAVQLHEDIGFNHGGACNTVCTHRFDVQFDHTCACVCARAVAWRGVQLSAFSRTGCCI